MYQMIGALGSLKSEYMDKSVLNRAITSRTHDPAYWSPDFSHATRRLSRAPGARPDAGSGPAGVAFEGPGSSPVGVRGSSH
jgi:hypothetical protein